MDLENHENLQLIELREDYKKIGLNFLDVVGTTFAKSTNKRLEEVYKDLRKESSERVWDSIQMYSTPDATTISC